MSKARTTRLWQDAYSDRSLLHTFAVDTAIQVEIRRGLCIVGDGTLVTSNTESAPQPPETFTQPRASSTLCCVGAPHSHALISSSGQQTLGTSTRNRSRYHLPLITHTEREDTLVSMVIHSSLEASTGSLGGLASTAETTRGSKDHQQRSQKAPNFAVE